MIRRPLRPLARIIEARIADAKSDDDAASAEVSRQILRLGRRLLLDDPDRVTLP